MILHLGDCVEFMRSLPDESVDAIVCDPPYGLGFMGKQWDALPPGIDWARECLRVVKPGGHLVAFGGTRTSHRLACALEDGGWEIRDSISWCYFSGFPKSWQGWDDKGMPEWDGFGTALKPAIEPATLCRKRLYEASIARQVLATGTGAINIDGCRFGYGDPAWVGPDDGTPVTQHGGMESGLGTDCGAALYGRFGATRPGQSAGQMIGRWPANLYYCPKASRKERERGCTGSPAVGEALNQHPTVKPVKLMRWLCRLVGGQPSSVILDPFMGSGSCGVAAVLEGFGYIGAELEPDYHRIAEARIGHARKWPQSWADTAPGLIDKPTDCDEQEQLERNGQSRLFE